MKSGVSSFCPFVVEVLRLPVERTDRVIPTPLVYIICPIKVCLMAWLAIGTPTGMVYTYP
jgi:hypothetical protein